MVIKTELVNWRTPATVGECESQPIACTAGLQHSVIPIQQAHQQAHDLYTYIYIHAVGLWHVLVRGLVP